jgi:putative ABC transport system permease protein
MLIILGYGLIIPWVVYKLSRAAKPLLDHLGVVASLAVGSIYRNISRTGLAIAALAIAVSATFGVDIMIGSFRSSVDQWLGATLQSDIYITSPSTVTTQPSPMLDPAVVAGVKTTPGIRSMSTGRSIRAATSVGSMDMLIVEPHEKSNAGFELIDSATDNPWPEWADERQIMVSEPLATKHNLSPGAEISIFTENAGNRGFTICAVYRDYGSSHGKLLMSRHTFNQYWNDDSVSTLGIVLDDQADHEQMTRLISERFSTPGQPLLVQSNARIHEQSLSVFDRTFEVTRVLRWLTVGVAFVGVFSALLALYLERAREFAILRASGATRQVVALVVFAKTLVMGLLAGLLALPLGWLMSEVLINVINMRSFGWSMGSQIPTGSVSESLLLACIAAVLAGVYPAYRLSRTDIASQLRDQ